MDKDAEIKFVGQPIFKQILKLIHPTDLDDAVRKAKSDHYYKAFKTKAQLTTLLFGIFSRCDSMTEICEGLRAMGGKLNHLGFTKAPAKSTASDGLRNRGHEVFEDIYFKMVKRYQSFLSDSRTYGLTFKEVLLIDSTTIRLFSVPAKLPFFPFGHAQRERKLYIVVTRYWTSLFTENCTLLFTDYRSLEKYDYEYKRNGTCNIFVAVEPKAGNHHIAVTDRRARKDFANFMKCLITDQYQAAKRIYIVLDNLNTHFKKSFYETFTTNEANQLLRRVKFIYTPKHASWLNMAEIEINLLDHECLSRNIGTRTKLESEIKAWSNENNKERRRITWSFTKYKADKKLSKYYVS